LICRLDGSIPTYVFFAPGDIKSEFGLEAATVAGIDGAEGKTQDALTVITPTAGTQAAITVRGKDGRSAKLLLLTQADALHVWKAKLAGAERLLMSRAELTFDGDHVAITGHDPETMNVSVYPAPTSGLAAGGKALDAQSDGLFTRYSVPITPRQVAVEVKKIKDAGPARPVVMGPSRRPPSPTEPVDADFDAAAVWQVTVPKNALEGVNKVILKIDYTGDVARASLGERFIEDDFYTGLPSNIGLNRFAPEVLEKGLTIKVLPLRKDLPIYLEPQAVPTFDGKGEALDLRGITAVPEYRVVFEAAK
jgi:hypothetical protein